MRLIKRPLFTALMALGVAFTAAAQQPPVNVPPTNETAPATSAAPPPADAMPGPTDRLTATDLEAWLDGFMPYALEQTDVAGSVVAVVKDGKVLLEKGYGFSDLAKRTPVDAQKTLFRPGSISKLFTWTAVMQLVEQGKLDLDADVNQYIDFKIPAYDGKPVTLRNIMTHTAGMEEVIRGLIANDEKEVLPLEATLKHWIPERIYAPGTTPAYSNYATALAGYIVQRVSGTPFDQYIEQQIFQPLRMNNSTFRQPVQKNFLAMTSKGYKSASDGKEQAYEYINLAPAGSLASPASDMANFMIAHLQDGEFEGKRILRADTAREMHGTGQTSVGPLNKMMLGFYETTANGHRAIAHGGDTQWFHSDLQLFPDDNIGIYVSTNSSGKDGSARLIRDGLVTGFVNRYLPPKDTSGGAGAGVDEATAKQHAAMIAGSYNSSRRADSNFMNLVYMLGQTKVSVNEDGTISVPMLAAYSGAPKKWKEISPFVWQDTNSGDRLAADVVDGKVTRFSAEPIASIMVFQRAAWWQTPAVFLTMLFGSLIALLLTVVAWPVSALVRRHYGVRYALAGADARAHRWVRIASLAVLASVGGMVAMVFSMMSDLASMGPSSDTMVILMRAITTILLPIGAAIALWNAWTVLRSNRRIWAKLWSVVLAAAGLALLFAAIAAHHVGFSPNYAPTVRAGVSHRRALSGNTQVIKTDRVELALRNELLRLSAPFRISGHVFENSPVTIVNLRQGHHIGRGEAAGVYYTHDTPADMIETLENLRETIEQGLTREELRRVLPAGGARNAVDCAMWELEARSLGMPAWKLAGLSNPKPLITTFTCGADTPEAMAEKARSYTHARAIKLKLTGEAELDIERLRAVRRARPDAWIGVDANQGYVPKTLSLLLPALVDENVSLLEQPCRRNHEADLDGIDHVVPIAADESILDLEELEERAHRFDVINIKLDKCGGLTEGLMMARRARDLGKRVMVGNMVGTSLAMAPAFVLGQHCDIVDLDGPTFLVRDRTPGVVYSDGRIDCPDHVWGAPDAVL